jgi:DNA-binding transcriptional LysR family regulator
MELEQLRMFITAAEHRGFSPAARHLYTSHSTVSRAVCALEEELGTALFIREHKLLTLTPAGEMLLEDAKTIVSMSDNITEKIKGLG